MGFFKNLFTPNKNITLNEKNVIKFKRIGDEAILIGTKVRLWNRPNSNQINVYLPYTYLGDGLIGITQNSFIADHLQKGGAHDSIVSSGSLSNIFIEIFLKNEFKTKEDYKREQQERWLENLKKAFKPKKGWNLRFTFDNSPQKKDKLFLGFNKLNDATFDIEDVVNNLWIENVNGEKISSYNASGSVDTVKALRALYSENNYSLKYSKKSGIYFSLEIVFS